MCHMKGSDLLDLFLQGYYLITEYSGMYKYAD